MNAAQRYRFSTEPIIWGNAGSVLRCADCALAFGTDRLLDLSTHVREQHHRALRTTERIPRDRGVS